MASFWGSRKRNADAAESNEARDGEHQYGDPTERTRLLPSDNNQGPLSPDDPAVSPLNLLSVRVLRSIALCFLGGTFICWTILLVSIFVTPPLMHSRGSGFFAFAFTTLAMGYLALGLLFFAVPSKSIPIWGGILAFFLVVDMLLIVVVPRIRQEEGWVGIISVVWAIVVSIYQIIQNRAVATGKREEEERLTGREETRRSLREWLAVTVETVALVVMALAAILIMATLSIRIRDATLEPRGTRYSVHGESYQVHLACVGNRTAENADEPTILLEGGYGPVEHTLQPFMEDAYRSGIIRMTADALSEALALADETGPWVVVSAGIGSIYSRLFASRHLLEVSGIFMIDPLHEAYLNKVGSSSHGFVLWLRGVISPLGLDRLAGAILRGRTREDRIVGRSAYQSDKFIKAKLQENLVAVTMTAAEVQSARNVQMGETPLMVISSGREIQKSAEWGQRQEDLSHITNKLLSWDIVHDAPHEVWTVTAGRQLLEQRLREMVKASHAHRSQK
ncbi:hypothetical protein N7470_008033 [Penicillium chermesinum]|nr:hypothetical protein N7470_008033 [Penicillium chermesinum]